MDFDEVVVKESPGLCRCCLSEGCYKDLGTEYSWMNETEVYADMLLECFDIGISQHMEGPNGPNRLICEVCITRLRDACNFKKQVLDSEKKFVDMLGRGDFKKVVMYQPATKTEPSAEGNLDEPEVEYLEEEMDFADDEPLKDEEAEPEEQPCASEITVAPLPVKGKRGRPRKTPEVVEKKPKVTKVEEKPKASKAAKDTTSSPYTKTETELKSDTEEVKNEIGRNEQRPHSSKTAEHASKARQRWHLRKLLKVVLENSNAIPFRSSGNKYRCFFCHSSFNYATQLRDHTATDHDSFRTNSLYKTICYKIQNSSAKVDITGLQCKICSKVIDSIEELLGHLHKEHGVLSSTAALEFLLSFKLNDGNMNCLTCGMEFPFFGSLLLHMHRTHSRREIICEKCGVSFATKEGVVKHQASAHPTENFQCSFCDKIFFAVHRKRDHEKRIHNERKRTCNICKEVLGSTFKKDTHMATVHNVWSAEFKCEKCPKMFRFKNLLLKHDKRVHLKEKNVGCEVCGMMFFDKKLLSLHMVRHSNEKPFECSVCSKRFPRKRGLDMHVRIHTNDKRCVCKECGKRFVQHTSLSLHLRVHHGKV